MTGKTLNELNGGVETTSIGSSHTFYTRDNSQAEVSKKDQFTSFGSLVTNIKGELSTIATSGEYSDLLNVPTNIITTTNQFSIGDMKHGQLQQSNHNGWLLWAEGVNLSKTTYATLWAWAGTNSLIGTLGEAGKFFVDIDADNFQLQGLSGRALGASGAGSGLTSRAFGAKTGAETHTLTESELPSGNTKRNSDILHWVASGPHYIHMGSYHAQCGNNSPHNNMQPTTFLNTFIYAGV